MGRESLISREVFATKFPKIEDVSLSFVYNFFTADESLNEEGNRQIDSRPLGTSESDSIDRRVLQKKVPRYVKISFKGVKSDNYQQFKDRAVDGLVSNNGEAGNINQESHITTNFFASSRFQDYSVRKKIMMQVMRLADMAGIDLEPENETSQSDIAETVDLITGDYVSKETLLGLVKDEVFEEVKFVNQVDQVPVKIYDDAQKFKTTFHIDYRFLGDIYSVNGSNPSRGIKGLGQLDDIKRSQEAARQNSSSAVNFDIDYEPSIKIINTPEEIDGHIIPTMSVVGYTITKSKVIDGKKIIMDKFYMDGADVTEFLDSRVAYGQTYIYEISAVSIVEMSIEEDEDLDVPSIQRVQFLVESNPSSDEKVLCVEEEAPPAPDAIFYRFDYNTSSLVIDWRHPITSQRDIKGFQVFRRSSIYENFELQKQYEFNDAYFEYPSSELPFDSLVEYSDYPVMSYEDLEFTRGSSFIYTVCSIDAHGYLSNYGTQTEVTFDTNTNKLFLRNISQPGAPRQYPNMYVSPGEAQNINSVRLSEDVMKDTGHTKMRVYFDPEYHKIVDSAGRDLKHLKDIAQNAVYKFEVLNIDRQKSKTLSISLRKKKS